MLTAEWKLEDALKIREEEGEARATRKIINHMHKEGFCIADIVKATKMPEKEIKKILGLK